MLSTPVTRLTDCRPKAERSARYPSEPPARPIRLRRGTGKRLFVLAAALLTLIPAPGLAADVFLVSHALSDNGDHDGYADTNETVAMQITVRNLSDAALTDVTALLETDDPKIECLVQHVVWVGDLAAGETRLIPGAFAFKVGDVNRSEPYEEFSASFRVVMSSPGTGALEVIPAALVLKLDLDVTGGAGPGPWFEGFESGGFGSFVPMNLDAGLYGLEASDGYRCQYSDPDWVNSNSYGQITDCWVGATALQADAFFWQVVDGQAGAYQDKSFTGRYSVWMGALVDRYLGIEVSTPMASLEALGSGAPVNLGWDRVCEDTRTIACTGDPDCPPGESCVGVASELSFKHQVDFVDWRLVGGRDPWKTSMGGAVAVQLADDAGNPVGDWIKLYAYTNVYDQQRDDQYTNCYFDPIDDGNTEDAPFDPSDPLRTHGPSTLCLPEWVFSRLGDTDAPFDTEEIGYASDGPGLAGATGLGTWVESRFNLQQFRGHSIRIRFISSGIKAGAAETFEDLFYWNPTAGDDGWWIDDVLITDTLAVPAVLSADTKDNSGLPAVVDGDMDGYCDSDCDDGDAACNIDCSDADADGVRGCDGDCDEGNPDVYPGAEEICDGVSNDCAEPLWPQLEVWTPTTIAGPDAGAISVFAADIDGDGDLDAVSASYDTDTIAWHENLAGDGSAWALHTISTTADGATGVYAADVNGDGSMDVLSASALDTTIAWYENTAGDGSAWTKREITTAMQYAGGLMAVDVDGDLDLDVLAAGADNDRIRWYENVTGDGTAWSPVTIVPAPSRALAIAGGDIDGDGKLDVAAAGLLEGVWETWWYRNKRGDGGMWDAFEIDRYWAVHALQVADIDGDGDGDLLAGQTGKSKVWWFENLSSSGAEWDRHEVADPVAEVRSVVAVDLDGDTDMDALAAGSWFGEVLWFENSVGDGSVWTARAVSPAVEEAASICVGDVDGDGDPDVLSAGADEVAWYFRGNLELDDDGDGVADCAGDCDDNDVTVWGLPGEVQDLTLLEDRQTLVWSAPADPGATTVVYNTLRGEFPDGFLGATCVEWGDGSDTEAVDTDAPASGEVYFYVVVAANPCGSGCAGMTSDDEEREVCACP